MLLNDQQNEAVKHVDGPLLIIAGAGTGKTRVITNKILHLIQNGLATSGEILALTFTDKAAAEMQERVDIEMPFSYEEIDIKTFHAFSDKLLRDFGLEMGLSGDYEILSQVDQWFFFKKNLFEFNLDYYRPLGNPNRFIISLLKHFGRLKDELIMPDQYIESAKNIADETERTQTLELAFAFKKYQELLIQNNYLDFADLTNLCLQLFEKRPGVLAKCQEKYKYILVDEFQDTNFAQFQLVLKLAGNRKNLTVVGDDDQSIYKWRGASLSNILQFEKYFPEAQKVVLQQNYRSYQNLLDSSYALIKNNNPDRLEVKNGINKKLTAEAKGAGAIEIHQFPNFMQESSFVAEKIKQLMEEGGVSYRDFAILVRANQTASSFIDELKFLGIPYQVRDPRGLLALSEIKDLVSVVQFLANHYNDIALLRILKIPVFDVPMTEILELLNNPKKEKIFDLFKDKNHVIPGTEGNAMKVYALLHDLIEFSKNNSVGRTLNEFLQKSGYLDFLIKNDLFEEMENINEFALAVTQFEKSKENTSAYDFATYISMLEEAGSTLNYNPSDDRDAVQILSVHGSKGLEFENVFIVSAVNHRFPSIKRRDPFEIPNELTKEIFPEGDFHLQEERRLFYVAMTRAKKNLFVTYSDHYEGNKFWKMSPFVSEVLESGLGSKINHEEEKNAISKLKNYGQETKPLFDLPKFQGKRVSYSQIDTFKTCPLKFNYRYLLKIPVSQSHAANFGSSVHSTLNEFYRLVKAGEKPPIETLQALYEKNWIPFGYESKEHENARKKKGFEILENFYRKNEKTLTVPAFLERPFNLKIGKYVVNGRIDRIDKLPDGSYHVIDYKTGSSKKEASLKNDLQLSIYALACRDIFKIKVSKLSLYFLEDNEMADTERTDAQLDALYVKLEEEIIEMEKSDFAATPGFLCQFCDYRMICPGALL